jgi:hypothetical protein
MDLGVVSLRKKIGVSKASEEYFPCFLRGIFIKLVNFLHLKIQDFIVHYTGCPKKPENYWNHWLLKLNAGSYQKAERNDAYIDKVHVMKFS